MLRKILSQIWGNVQYLLFPELEEEIGPLTETHKKLISVLELVRIEQFVSSEIGLMVGHLRIEFFWLVLL